MADLGPKLRARVEREYPPEDRAAAEEALLSYEAPGDVSGGSASGTPC